MNMKKIFPVLSVIIGVLFAASAIKAAEPGLRNWQIYTNTTHIYEVAEAGNKIYQATWGGLKVYDIATDQFIKTYTGFDGLQDLDVKSISYLTASGTLALGTASAGVNRLLNEEFLIPVNKVIGLPTNNVKIVASSEELLFVVTGEGLTVFKDVPDFPYPLPIDHYSTHNGLASDNITSIGVARDDYLFIGTDRGLNYVPIELMYDVNEWRLLHKGNSPLPSNNITSCSIRNDMIAIGTKEGLLKGNINFDEQADNFFNWLRLYTPDTHPLASAKIFSVYLDKDYNTWLSYGTWNEINLFIEDTELVVVTKVSKDEEFRSWEINEDGLFSDQIRGFKQINGTIYLYTWGDGLFFLENGYWNNRQTSTMAANNITDISIDKNGKVWVCNGIIGGEAQRRGHPGVSGFDGVEWTTFREDDSPLVSNRIFRVVTDARNRKWFGSWNHGISVFDEDNDIWHTYNRANGLPANEVGAIATDEDDNIWISAYSGGMVILELDAIEQPGNIPVLASFHLYSPNVDYSDVINIFPMEERTFFGSYYSGIRIWDAPGFPQTHQPGDAWKQPPMSGPSLSDGFVYIYGIDSRETYWGEEIWIASENGLFMYDTYRERWYHYTTRIKRNVWVNNSWQRDRLYFEDEERLFGAAPTFPTAVYIDDFDRIWIGTEANGITLYDLNTDRYTILNSDNTPLLSNHITALDYEPYSGNLFIGTDKGLNSVEIGKTKKREDPPLAKTVVYPNPFYPEKGQILTIANKEDSQTTIMPQGDNKCRIYDVSGDLIITLEENRYYEFSWDGKNSNGGKVGSGIYYYVVSSPGGQTERGTIVLVR